MNVIKSRCFRMIVPLLCGVAAFNAGCVINQQSTPGSEPGGILESIVSFACDLFRSALAALLF